MIKFEKVEKRYGDKVIFNKFSTKINRGNVIGLIGHNGAGKTSIMKMIMDTSDYNGKIINEFKNTIYITSFPEYDGDKTIKECIASNVGHQKEILKVLGYKGIDMKKVVKNLSGGERTRLAIAGALLSDADFIMLDEPTNHLDIRTIEWLTNIVNNSNKTFMIVSHNFTFLENTVNRVIEIRSKEVEIYNTTWKNYIHEKSLNELAVMERNKQLKKKMLQLEDALEFQQTANENSLAQGSSGSVSNRKKQLERKERELVKLLRDQQGADFAALIDNSKEINPEDIVMEINIESKSFADRELLKNVKFDIKTGAKVGIFGPNGSGKSTIIKCIQGETDFIGDIKINPEYSVGYFDQSFAELEENSRLMDQLLTLDNDIYIIQDVVEKLGFVERDLYKDVSRFSMGEKNKILLAKLFVVEYDVLILDEIDNYLDIRSKRNLVKLLSRDNKTIIIVSHDRKFLDGIATDIYEVKDKTLEKVE